MSKKELIAKKLPPLTYPDCYNYILSLKEEDYRKYLRLVYFNRCRILLDYKNPKYFSEKLQWIKLNDATPQKTYLTDKVTVRDYVEKSIGKEYLKEIYDVQKEFKDLNFDKIPKNFVLKCNHGCKFNYFILDKSKLIQNRNLLLFLEKKFNKWLSMQFIGMGILELQYKNIPPRVFAEEYIKSDKDNLDEYQVYCFHGEPKLVEKIIYNIPDYRVLYDENLNISNIKFNYSKSSFEKPEKKVYEILELAKILSKDINFVRVDFLLANNKVLFNEMTFTPYSGFMPLKRNDDLLLGTYLHNIGDNYGR